MDIRGVQKLTLVDFPGRIGAIFFTGKCNFRCPYCHNPCLVLDPESQPGITREEFIDFLEKRKGRLEGVVFSGGEPTLQPDLPEYAAIAASMGYAVKIDTNGTSPDMTEFIWNIGALTMLGIDYKAPAARYAAVTGCRDPQLVQKVKRTITFAAANNIELDIRTTVHRAVTDEEDLRIMAEELRDMGVKSWNLQQFTGEDIIDTELAEIPTYSLAELQKIASDICDFAKVRG